jgi:hypothetical protein
MLVGFSLLLLYIIYLCWNLWLTVLDSGFGTYCSCIIALCFTRGTEHWNLAWPVRARATWAVQRFSRGHLEDLGDILVWLFWNIGYLLWKVGIFFLVSIVCDCDCACGFGSVPSLLRLVYTIDFNELT